MVSKKILTILAVVFLLSFATASFHLGGQNGDSSGGESKGPFGNPNNSIDTSYAIGENLTGWINTSFEEESGGSVFQDSEGNSITLLELLEADSRHDFSCNPEDCSSFYAASNPETTKSLDLSKGQESLNGFELSSNIDEFNNFSLEIQSNQGPSCRNQVEVDMFKNGNIDTGNSKMANSLCSDTKSYGCFDPEDSGIKQGTLSTSGMYCQQMKLPKAPGFETGLWVKNESGKLNITMELYKDGSFLGDQGAKCYLDNSEINSNGKEVSCEMDYYVREASEYYVCAYSQGDNNGEYKIQSSTGENSCGFRGEPGLNKEHAGKYRIFFQPYQFGSVGTLEISNTLPDGTSVTDKIQSYVYQNNGDLDCSQESCIIPINFKSGSDQTLDVSGSIEYDSQVAFGQENTDIYEVSETLPKINTSYQKIYFDNANFSLPKEAGEYEYSMDFKNYRIFSKNISLETGATIYSINPQQTAVGLPTTFTVSYGEKNVSEFEWDFENESAKTTQTNSIEHTFSEEGNKTLSITVTDVEGRTSEKSFEIEVGPASSVLRNQTSMKKDSIEELRNQMSSFGVYPSEAIEQVLNLSGTESELSEIEKQASFEENVSDEDLLQRILQINIPESIKRVSEANSIPIAQEQSSIGLDAAETASGNFSINSSLEEEYKDSIQKWALENVEAKISGGSFSADYGSGNEPLVTAFTLDLTGPNEDYYVFLKNSQEWEFNDPEIWEESSGYSYTEISGQGSVSFYSEGHSTFEDLPFFVSPDLGSLKVVSVPEEPPEEAGKDFNWVLYGIIAFGVLILGLVAYYFLKKWYDQRYEDYLFKDKNKLYNLVVYVQRSKQKGNSDSQIKQALRSNWSNEQINYVLKKFKGKEVTLPSFGLISPSKADQSSAKKKSPKKKMPRKRPPIKKKFPRKR